METCLPLDTFKTHKCDYTNPGILSKYLQNTYTQGFMFAVLAKILGACMNKMLYFKISGLIWKSCTHFLIPINKKECVNKFEVIPINYILSNNILHTNVILIDHEKRVIEIFEPYGASRITQSCDQTINDVLTEMYSNYKIVFPEIVCSVGPQTLEKSDSCFLWSALYFYLRIKCYHLSREQLIDGILDLQLNQNSRIVTYLKSYLKYGHTHNLILGFGCYLNNLFVDLALEPFSRFFLIIQGSSKQLNESNMYISDLTNAYLSLDIDAFIQILLDNNLYNSTINNIIISTPFLYDLLTRERINFLTSRL